MTPELTIDIGSFDVQCFGLSPLLDTHLLYQAQIEEFGVVLPDLCLICVGMEAIAGKVCAFKAVCNAFLARAAEDSARPRVAQT